MPRNQPKIARQPRHARLTENVKPLVIDNRRFPTTDEVAKLLGVPPARVRQLKKMVAEIMDSENSE